MFWCNSSMTFLLLVVFVLFASITGVASQQQQQQQQQLRSNIGKGDVDDGRKLQAQTLPPPNDDCKGAMIIPSNFPGTTYTTEGVSIAKATLSTGLPYHSCYLPNRTKDVWYQFTPSMTQFYNFSTNVGSSQMVLFRSYGTKATSCQNTRKFDCQVARPSIEVKLNRNQTYHLFVQPALLNLTGPLQLTVQRKRPPSNNFCTNATIINPTVPTSFTIDDFPYAVQDPTIGPSSSRNCYISFDERALIWYKIKNPFTTPLSIELTVSYASNYDTIEMTVARGLNCSAFDECVYLYSGTYYKGKRIYDFVAAGLTTYYVSFRHFIPAIPMNLTITSRAQYFSVVDPVTDKAVQLLKPIIDYDKYEAQSSMNLNIQANFPTSSKSINSVRLTYDNPKRNVCDNKAPYSVFGDSQGDYNSAIIPLGPHRVTATPYTQTNCTGTAGTPIVQDFTVAGCFTEFTISAVGGTSVKLIPFTSLALSRSIYDKHTKLPVNLSLLCKIDLYMYANCGFPIKSMRTELRNAATGKLILASDSWDLIENGHLAAGSYSIRSILDNVTHPTINFTVVNTTCDE